MPYLIGRLYFGNPEDLRYFATAMVVGGLFYVLPCLYEIRMSPTLMSKIYGMSDYGKGPGLGGYRPNVFFYTGLELGMWMTAASLAGWWLWRCGVIKKIGPFPFGSMLLPILMGTTILCRSTGAIALLVLGMMLLWFSVRFRTRLLLASFLFVAPLYVTIRVTNLWSGQQAVDLAESLVGPARAESLEYRFRCENLLIAKAVEQPVFGWGGWGRSSAYFNADSPWRKPVPTDGLWIIILGTQGIRRSDPVLPGLDLAGGLVRLAISSAVMGGPPRGGWLARRGAADAVHSRLPAERLPEHDLRDAGGRAHRRGAKAASNDRGGARWKGCRPDWPWRASGGRTWCYSDRTRPARWPDHAGGPIPRPGTVFQA